MRYALLIYENNIDYQDATPEQWQEAMEAHGKFSAEAAERSMNPGGEALQPTATARTVRFDNSTAAIVTDGPFAETKEQLGGFYILDCQSIDEAIEMAKKLPVLNGSVEVRPVIEF